MEAPISGGSGAIPSRTGIDAARERLAGNAKRMFVEAMLSHGMLHVDGLHDGVDRYERDYVLARRKAIGKRLLGIADKGRVRNEKVILNDRGAPSLRLVMEFRDRGLRALVSKTCEGYEPAGAGAPFDHSYAAFVNDNPWKSGMKDGCGFSDEETLICSVSAFPRKTTADRELRKSESREAAVLLARSMVMRMLVRVCGAALPCGCGSPAVSSELRSFASDSVKPSSMTPLRESFGKGQELEGEYRIRINNLKASLGRLCEKLPCNDG